MAQSRQLEMLDLQHRLCSHLSLVLICRVCLAFIWLRHSAFRALISLTYLDPGHLCSRSIPTTDLTHHHVAVGPFGFWVSTLLIGAVSTLKQMQKHHAPSGYSGIIGRNVHKCLWDRWFCVQMTFSDFSS